MRRFYASDKNFDGTEIILDPEQARHLRTVLRLSEGDNINVFDGAGREFFCVVEKIDKRETTLGIINEIPPAAAESGLNLTLAMALLKGEKFDLVIQKAVELGVTKLSPIITKRCDIKLRESRRKIARWEKIVIESSKQSGRARLMNIDDPTDFESFIGNPETTGGGKILFSEKGGDPFGKIDGVNKITAVVGPEGGWDPCEIEFAVRNNFQIITMSGRILRAETAGIVITGLLQHKFGDLK